MRRTVAGIAVICMLLTGCAFSSTHRAAKSAYEACEEPDQIHQRLERDGKHVRIAIRGDDARDMSGMEDDWQAIRRGDTDGTGDGLGIGLSLLLTTDCLVDETGYPGSAEQLSDGDKWDGWLYREVEGPGSEFAAIFTATR